MVGSSWWRAHLKLLQSFNDNTHCKDGDGTSVLLWHDSWLDKPLIQKLPELHSFAKDNNQTLASILRNADIYEHFHTPLFAQAFSQFEGLLTFIEQNCNPEIQERWCLSSEKSKYSSMKMYLALIGGRKDHILFQWLWKCAGTIKHMIFFWLLHDRVNTRNLLKRKSMHLKCYECVFYNERFEETSLHLF